MAAQWQAEASLLASTIDLQQRRQQELQHLLQQALQGTSAPVARVPTLQQFASSRQHGQQACTACGVVQPAQGMWRERGTFRCNRCVLRARTPQATGASPGAQGNHAKPIWRPPLSLCLNDGFPPCGARPKGGRPCAQCFEAVFGNLCLAPPVLIEKRSYSPTQNGFTDRGAWMAWQESAKRQSKQDEGEEDAGHATTMTSCPRCRRRKGESLDIKNSQLEEMVRVRDFYEREGLDVTYQLSTREADRFARDVGMSQASFLECVLLLQDEAQLVACVCGYQWHKPTSVRPAQQPTAAIEIGHTRARGSGKPSPASRARKEPLSANEEGLWRRLGVPGAEPFR